MVENDRDGIEQVPLQRRSERQAPQLAPRTGLEEVAGKMVGWVKEGLAKEELKGRLMEYLRSRPETMAS